MTRVRLGSILIEQKESVKSPDGNGLNLIGVSNEIGLHVSRAKRINDLSKYKLIEKGWFAYNPMRVNVGSIGYVYKNDQIGIVSPDYVVFSCSDKILPEYLLYLLKSDEGIEAINKNASGAVRKRLYFSDLARIEIELPTIESQRNKLIAFRKIKELGYQISENRSKYSLISQLKQSILQEAIQGKLTAAWRKQNPNAEPASELLKRIKAEKQKLIAEKKIRKQKPLLPITQDEIPFELPDGWVWCRLGEICSKTGSGSTPKGGKAAYPSSGIKFLRSQNVYDDGLRYEGIAYIHEETHEKMSSTQVQAEDLLLNITGGSIGRCCIVPKDFDTGNINQHVSIIRTVKPFLGYYIHHVICSPYFQNMIIKVQTGAGREGLPKNKMDNILISLPPEEEQKEINNKVKTLMEKCRSLETEIGESEQHAQMLMQAVLKEAFEHKKEEVHA